MLRAVQYVRPRFRASRTFLQSTTTLVAGRPISKRLKDAVDRDIYFSRDTPLKEKKFEDVSTKTYNISKALKALKDKYDAVAFVDENQKAFDIQKLKTRDLKYNSPTARVIFDNLLRIKLVTNRQIDRNLALALLGTDGAQLSDKFYISQNVRELLSIDGDITRALYLCRIANKESAIVGMNMITQWLLSRGKIDEALKVFNTRKNSGIPSDNYTYITLFDGIAKQLEWGYPTRNYIWKAINIFKGWRKELAKSNDTVPAEGFNACLSILVKDFTERQALAWKFFDELADDKAQGLRRIDADAQTFTILMQGIKRYTELARETLLKDSKIDKNSRTLLLMDLEAGHVKIAQLVMDRAKQLATPPIKTGDEVVDAKAIRYWNKTKLEIDIPLVSVYLNSLISRDSGTGMDLRLGSHYLYNQAALEILRQVSPEIDGMLQFVEKVTGSSACIPTKEFKRYTDMRFNDAVANPNGAIDKLKYIKDVKSLDPRIVVADLDVPNFNPQVILPTTSNFPKRLVLMIDFARGVRSTDNRNKQYSVNKFILNQTFDSLVNLGRWNELVIAYWYSMIQWGGLHVDLSIFENRPNVVTGVLQKGEILEPSKSDKGLISSIVDELTPELFVTKILEDRTKMEKGLTKTRLILELFELLATKKFNPNGVVLRYEAIKRIWLVFNRDITYYNNSSKASQTNKNHPCMMYHQAEDLAKNLVMFGALTHNWTRKFTSRRKVPNDYYAKMNEILKIMYKNKWLNTTSEQTIYLHKLLVKACIRYYKSESFVKPYESGIEFPDSLKTSMGYLIKSFDPIKNLTGNNVQLLVALKKLRGLKSHDKQDPNDSELKGLIKKIYDIIDVDDQQITEEVVTKATDIDK